MQANDRGVEVEIRVDGGWIALTLGEAKFVGKEHEDAGEIVIKIAMALPESAMHYILGVVTRLRSMDVLQDGPVY